MRLHCIVFDTPTRANNHMHASFWTRIRAESQRYKDICAIFNTTVVYKTDDGHSFGHSMSASESAQNEKRDYEKEVQAVTAPVVRGT